MAVVSVPTITDTVLFSFPVFFPVRRERGCGQVDWIMDRAYDAALGPLRPLKGKENKSRYDQVTLNGGSKATVMD